MSCSGVFQTGFHPRLLLFGSCLLCYCLPQPVVSLSYALVPTTGCTFGPTTRYALGPAAGYVLGLVADYVHDPTTCYTLGSAVCCARSRQPCHFCRITCSAVVFVWPPIYILYRPGVVEATDAPPSPLLSQFVFSPFFLSLPLLSHSVFLPFFSFPTAPLSFRFFPLFLFPPLLSRPVFSLFFLSCRFSLLSPSAVHLF